MISNAHLKNSLNCSRTPNYGTSVAPKPKITNLHAVVDGCQREISLPQELFDFLSTSVNYDQFIKQSLFEAMEKFNENGGNYS